MDFRLPIPKNWQDFESICHQLWKEIWNDPNAEKNGRQGQAQSGVDIFGTPIYSNNFAGVQCKDKDGMLGSKLKVTELKSECKKAQTFLPQITSFSLATTASRDANIQMSARQLTDQKAYPFNVQVWSWDDIQSEIIYRPSILSHYYPTINQTFEEQLQVSLNRYSPKDIFHAYFTRPPVKNLISESLKNSLIALAYELSDNSYRYGKATEFKIIVEDKKISFIDNGAEFNPITQLDAELVCAESNVGSYVFKEFSTQYESLITINYYRNIHNNKEVNLLEFEITGDLEPLEKKDFIEIFINLSDVADRESARRKVNLLNITPEMKEIIVTLTHNVGMSFSTEFIRVLLNKLNENQKLILSIPRDSMFRNLKSLFKDDRLIVNIR